jgi:two-component system chemotaxis response regulator CheB
MPVRVLIAEDSSYQRKLIKDMLLSNQEISKIDIARNGREAIEKIEKFNPDVLVLDLVMPEIDGLTVFKFLSEHYPIPTIIFSAKNPATLDDSVQALLLGAFDFITKPKGLWKDEFPKYQEKLISSVLYAAKIKKTYEKRNVLIKKSFDKQSLVELENSNKPLTKVKTVPISLPKKTLPTFESNIIVIGTSTGGPRTLKALLKQIPKDFPSPILIVQHMDAYFMKQFALSLDELCNLPVKIAENSEKIKPGVIYLSPGAKHMKIQAMNGEPRIKIFEDKPVNFCIPSVDVLFFSASKVYKNHTLGILLTGMGEDGAAGLEAIKSEGGKTIAESEETCVLYGMPKAAMERGAASLILPNYNIPSYMMKYAKKYRG